MTRRDSARRRLPFAFLTMLFAHGLSAAELPNILWLTSEDNGPHLGCYGDEYADSPHIDAFARRGVVYQNAWSNAPVCAPARTTIISGLYPTSTGSEHMRSLTRLPSGIEMFPKYLRDAGYWTTNNSKEDYNLEKRGAVWDQSSRSAHWRGRAAGQPFFSVFNYTTTHESQIRIRPHRLVHDPAKVRVPAYHPDTPEVRLDWAQYYDKITVMDRQIGEALAELESDGLAGETIVFYYGDHGSGMPRSKRWPYDSGLRVPLVVSVPEKHRALVPEGWTPGSRSDRLVAFIDLAPTVLSLAGIRPPEHLQGRAFLGKFTVVAPQFAFGFRGRMDERYDLVRTVRDERFVYVRNYMPHEIQGQHVSYMFETPTTRIWKQLFDAGKLSPEQARFWQQKPAEELYDLETDRDEVRNLADSAEHHEVLARLRRAHREHVLAVRDLGFLPEDEIHSRAALAGVTPWDVGRDETKYPLARVFAAAEIASSRDPNVEAELVKALDDGDGAVRYWGAMGLLIRGDAAVSRTRVALRRALDDTSSSVRVVAARALASRANAATDDAGASSDLAAALDALVHAADQRESSVWVAILALNALDALGERARPVAEKIRALPESGAGTPGRMAGYVPRLLEKIRADFDE